MIRVSVRVCTRGGTHGGQLAGSHAAVDELLGLFQGFFGGLAVAEEDEAIALGAAGDLVGDDADVVDGAEGGEGEAEGVGGGVESEAVDEDLAEGGIEVGGGADGGEGRGVCKGGGAEEGDELFLGEGFQELQDAPWRRLLRLVGVVVGVVLWDVGDCRRLRRFEEV